MAWWDDLDFLDEDVGGAFDMGGFDIGNVDLSGAFDLEGLNLGDIGVGSFDLGGFNLGDLDLSGAFDLEGLNLGDLGVGAFDLGGLDLGQVNLENLGMADVDLGNVDFGLPSLENIGLGAEDLGTVDFGGLGQETIGMLPEDLGNVDFGGISEDVKADILDPYKGLGYTQEEIEQLQKGTYGGAEQTESQLRSQLGDDLYEEMYGPYAGLGYSKKDIDQLKEGTFAGQEQTEAQVKSQLGEELYNELYPQGVDKLSSGSYTGLGYTAKEIADMMEAAGGVKDTDWKGEIKGSDITSKTGTDGKKTTEDKKPDDKKTIVDEIAKRFGTDKSNLALITALLGGLMGLLGKNKPAAPAGYKGSIPKYMATRGKPGEGTRFVQQAAGGGLMGLSAGGRPARYLRGGTDGMADKIETDIDGKQPARLSHGEFVIPADVVSHLGNGNSDAGADVLYDMMAKVRKARTGTPKQGKQINPRKYTPA